VLQTKRAISFDQARFYLWKSYLTNCIGQLKLMKLMKDAISQNRIKSEIAIIAVIIKIMLPMVS
jgi:hypothetical protein